MFIEIHYIEDIRTTEKDYLNDPKVISKHIVTHCETSNK